MQIRAILINSDTGKIADVQIEQGSLQDLYRLIVGTNAAGDDVSAKTPLDVIKKSVQFMFDVLRV